MKGWWGQSMDGGIRCHDRYMDQIPDSLREERDQLIMEIHAAFEGVTLEKGVSWSETESMDGGRGRSKVARRKDECDDWKKVAADDKWDPDSWRQPWPFLDAEGFRYYLPAAMARLVHTENVAFVDDALCGGPAKQDSQNGARFALLNDQQRHCVSRFLRYMIDVSIVRDNDGDLEAWQRAYESYWHKLE